jgi:putative redox protein
MIHYIYGIHVKYIKEMTMAILKINTPFNPDFTGKLVTQKAEVAIGSGEGRLLPYDMLLGALSACLYSTFLDIAIKKRIEFDMVDIEVTGEKRTEIPTTLAWVKVVMNVKGAKKEKGLVEAGQLAAQYCSIYQTLSHVAQMYLEVTFE